MTIDPTRTPPATPEEHGHEPRRVTLSLLAWVALGTVVLIAVVCLGLVVTSG